MGDLGEPRSFLPQIRCVIRTSGETTMSNYPLHQRRLHRFIVLWRVALALALLGALIPTATFAAIPDEDAARPPALANAVPGILLASTGAVTVQAVPNAPNACPASPSGLPDVIERTNFCVYYDDGNVTDGQADDVADFTQLYWDRYVTDFGFRAPAFTNKLVIEIQNDTSCNGGTSPSSNDFYVYDECFDLARLMQKVVGHELFHRVQYAYHGTEVKWFKEGTARAIEDLAFAELDNWPQAMSAPSSFNSQADNYLMNTNVDITSIPQRYNSALWWKYFTEQFGSDPDEPELGVDALLRLWEAAETLDDIAALNQALTNLGAGANFDVAFRKFVAANWLKDLGNQPNAEYNYIDEDQTGNPDQYGPLFPTNGGAISTGSPATWSNQSVSRYGARYFSATPGGTCPVLNGTFHTDSGPAFYHIIAEKAGVVEHFQSSTAGDFSLSFFNDGLTRLVGIAGSTNADAQVDVTLQCVNPTLTIQMPNSGAVSFVGPFNGPGKFLAQVLVTDGSPNGPVVSGLTVNDFKAFVNGQPALITTGAFIQQQYWLVVQAPNQVSDGVYDLEVRLEASGTATTIATDTNSASVEYNGNNLDHVLVIDRSGSMASDEKMDAAKDAAKLYVDITRNSDGLAVVPYNEDVNPAPFPMTAVTTAPNVRENAKSFIQALFPDGWTSIGDGLAEAVSQRAGSPTANPVCSYVLLSDGLENSSQFWSGVQASVVASGCPVTAIAFGAASDETLMQNIATATGGAYFFNDVYVSAVAAAEANAAGTPSKTRLDLGDTYEYAQSDGEGRERILAERGTVPLNQDELNPAPDQIHKVMIDPSVTNAVFTLDWTAPLYGQDLLLKLRMPDGTILTPEDRPYTFEDLRSEHLGWRIPDPMPGTWELIVNARSTYVAEPIPYQVTVSARSNINAFLLLPARLGIKYFTGNRLALPALLSGDGPIGNARMVAIVTAPDGTETRIRLFDDGQHDDGQAGDGFYNGYYTKVNQAQLIPPNEDGPEPTEPTDEGSYRVRLLIEGEDFQRQALGAFSVQEGEDVNNNGLPDPFETENGVSIDSSDGDLDMLDALSEYQIGTDVNDSDTDGGGENDGSEYFQGKDPFDPSDDEIEAPEYLKTEPGIAGNTIYYHVRDEYSRMVLYRAMAPDGPWQVRQPELPADGVYEDPADNGQTYFYRYMAIDGDDNRSAVVDSSPVTPSEDPFLPEADILIDGGAATTPDLNVELTFVPATEDTEYFEDIVAMKLSNSPDLAGAEWQPFDQTTAWTLAATPAGEQATVYGQFRDDADNESLVTTASIIVSAAPPASESVFLPIVTNQ
jgi:hypothetical protein